MDSQIAFTTLYRRDLPRELPARACFAIAAKVDSDTRPGKLIAWPLSACASAPKIALAFFDGSSCSCRYESEDGHQGHERVAALFYFQNNNSFVLYSFPNCVLFAEAWRTKCNAPSLHGREKLRASTTSIRVSSSPTFNKGRTMPSSS